MTKLYNRTTELNKRKRLRKEATKTERIIWSKLKNKQLLETKFKRQYSIGPYIVDFYSPSAKLAIEIDGSGHYTDEGIEYDRVRNEYIESAGIRVIRFTNIEVNKNLKGVLDRIAEAVDPLCRSATSPP